MTCTVHYLAYVQEDAKGWGGGARESLFCASGKPHHSEDSKPTAKAGGEIKGQEERSPSPCILEPVCRAASGQG